MASGDGLEYTPSGKEADTYQYYCPLCMNYYKGIFESNCCRHLVCYGCLINYVAGKYGVTAEDLPYLEVPFLFPIPCPHCNSLAFEPHSASKHSVVRSYKDEKDFSSNSSSSQWSNNGLSPVRPGDSFEKLQRKMIRYDSSASNGGPEPPTPAESIVTEVTVDDDEASTSSNMRPQQQKEEVVVGPAVVQGTSRQTTSSSSVMTEQEGEEEEVLQGPGTRKDDARHLTTLGSSPTAAML